MSISTIHSAKAEEKDALQFSGFARVVLGYLDDSHSSYLGYEDKVSIDKQSLIGLQADYQIIDELSVTGQFVGHAGSEKESGVEWLYFTYQPNRSTQIKLGKQRSPLFSYSDSIDVGFAYPWITLPQQVYSSFFFSNFDGILANYEWSTKDFVVDFEGYWGNVNDTIYAGGVGVESKVKDYRGLIAKLSYDSWAFRASYHTAEAEIEVNELTELSNLLNQFGFNKSANSLSTNGVVEFFQVAANYENLDYFFRSELTRTRTEAPTIPDIDSYYVTAGYNYYPFLSYISLAQSKGSFEQPINEIPLGFDPQLDALAFGYLSASQLPFDSSKSLAIGTRWDWKHNIAFKAEITWTEHQAGTRQNVSAQDAEKLNNKIPLYQLALEWVF